MSESENEAWAPLYRDSTLYLPAHEIDSFAIAWAWQNAREDDYTGPLWVDWALFHASGRDNKGVMLFTKAGHENEHTPDVMEAATCASGMVKWDGCTQFDADVHIDGFVREFCQALEYAQGVAEVEIMAPEHSLWLENQEAYQRQDWTPCENNACPGHNGKRHWAPSWASLCLWCQQTIGSRKAKEQP